MSELLDVDPDLCKDAWHPDWTLARRPLGLDWLERPCADCEVGEPHLCHMLIWVRVRDA